MAPKNQPACAIESERQKELDFGRDPSSPRQFCPDLRGRPKNARNFKIDLLDELGEQIPIRENGRDRKISKQRAFIKALVAAAIKGDMRATNALVSFCTRSLGGQADEDVSATPTADDIDIIETFVERERKRRRSQAAKTKHTNPTKK